MRIIKLEIQDFRAFYGNHIIEFAKEREANKIYYSTAKMVAVNHPYCWQFNMF